MHSKVRANLGVKISEKFEQKCVSKWIAMQQIHRLVKNSKLCCKFIQRFAIPPAMRRVKIKIYLNIVSRAYNISSCFCRDRCRHPENFELKTYLYKLSKTQHSTFYF